MPIYEYKCVDCGQRIERLQRIDDPAPDACESCGGGPMQREISAPAFQFKGTGWYVTDYADRKGPADKTDAASDAGSKKEKPKTDTATDKAKSSSATPAAKTAEASS